MQALKNSDFMYFSLCKLMVLLYTVINTISYEIHLVLKFQSKLELKFHISSYPFQHKKKLMIISIQTHANENEKTLLANKRFSLQDIHVHVF